MRPYTVVLRRPEALYDLWRFSQFDRERDTYIAHVYGVDAYEAVKNAKNEVRRKDNEKGVKALEYITLVVFEGTSVPLYFGWQAGVDQ